jgi:hypothetical protein
MVFFLAHTFIFETYLDILQVGDSMNNEKKDNFMIIESWLMKLYSYLVIVGSILVGLLLIFQDTVLGILQFMTWILVIALYSLIGIFVVSVFQVFRYFFVGREKRAIRSIKKSIIIIITSPISIFIYWMLAFVLLLSMASCS